MAKTLRVAIITKLLGTVLLFAAPAWGQVPGRMVVTSPDGTREVEVSPGQAIYVTCPDGTCTGGGGVAADVNLTKIGGVVLGGANVIDVPNTAIRMNCVVGCGASSFTDNSAFTFGTTAINITGYVFDDVAPNAATENRAAAPRMSGNRVPYSILRDAAGNERGANVNSSNELKVSLGDIIGVESAVTVHSSSLQIGGTTAPGGEWHAATTTNIAPGANAYGLVVRDPSAISVNSGALNTTGYGINTYSRSDSLVHSIESRDSTPLGTEYALLTRNIPSGTQAISAASLPLPTGAALEATQLLQATAAKQDLLLAELQLKADLTETQPVSVASLPLPTGAATAALQTQPGVDIGDVTINNAAGAAAVNVQDGGNSLTIDATSLPLPTGAATEATLLNTLTTAAFQARINTLGQKTMANSTPVVVAADQTLSTKTILTTSAPGTVSVGIASGVFVAANFGRKGLVITNISNATVCFGVATAAILSSGICLQPGAVWNMNEYTLTNAAINAIASAAASTVSYQEFN